MCSVQGRAQNHPEIEPAAETATCAGNILAKGHEVMLGVTCENCAVRSDGEDGIAVNRPRPGFFPLRAAGEQDTSFGQQPPQHDPCATILCKEPRPGGSGQSRRSNDPERADREKSRRMFAFREVSSHLAFCAMLGCTTRTCVPQSEAGPEVGTTPHHSKARNADQNRGRTSQVKNPQMAVSASRSETSK